MVVSSVAKAHMVLWQNILLGCLKCSTVWPRAHKYMMQQLKSLTLEFSSLTSPRNDSVYDLCKDLTSVTRWQRISSGWGRVGLCSEQSCSESQQECSAQLWKAGKGRIQPRSGLDGAPGSSLLTGAAKPEVTRCQPGSEFLLNAFQITQEVNFVILDSGFVPGVTSHTGWVNPAVRSNSSLSLDLFWTAQS